MLMGYFKYKSMRIGIISHIIGLLTYAFCFQDVVDWYLSLRAASVQIMKKSNPALKDEEVRYQSIYIFIVLAALRETCNKFSEPCFALTTQLRFKKFFNVGDTVSD